MKGSRELLMRETRAHVDDNVYRVLVSMLTFSFIPQLHPLRSSTKSLSITGAFVLVDWGGGGHKKLLQLYENNVVLEVEHKHGGS